MPDPPAPPALSFAPAPSASPASIASVATVSAEDEDSILCIKASLPTPSAAPVAARAPRTAPTAVAAAAAGAGAVASAPASAASQPRALPSTASSSRSDVASGRACAEAAERGDPSSPRIEPAPEAAAAAREAEVDIAGLRVLLVDDVASVRRLGEALLRKLRCECVCLEDGTQIGAALTAAARPFDCIVLDIVMRHSDGADVCAALRGGAHARCAIVALTGNVLPADVARYFAMGFDTVLAKPFTRASVAAALSEARAQTDARLAGDGRGGNARFARLSATEA